MKCELINFFALFKDGFLERLSSSEFVALSREVEKFVTDCETISGRRCMSLRFSLQSQVSEGSCVIGQTCCFCRFIIHYPLPYFVHYCCTIATCTR